MGIFSNVSLQGSRAGECCRMGQVCVPVGDFVSAPPGEVLGPCLPFSLSLSKDLCLKELHRNRDLACAGSLPSRAAAPCSSIRLSHVWQCRHLAILAEWALGIAALVTSLTYFTGSPQSHYKDRQLPYLPVPLPSS